jgi:hypothetical protein
MPFVTRHLAMSHDTAWCSELSSYLQEAPAPAGPLTEVQSQGHEKDKDHMPGWFLERRNRFAMGRVTAIKVHGHLEPSL